MESGPEGAIKACEAPPAVRLGGRQQDTCPDDTPSIANHEVHGAKPIPQETRGSGSEGDGHVYPSKKMILIEPRSWPQALPLVV